MSPSHQYLIEMNFAPFAAAPTPQEMVTSLPLWPRAQTRVVPLGTFEWRAAAIRERLHKMKAHMEATAQTARTGA